MPRIDGIGAEIGTVALRIFWLRSMATSSFSDSGPTGMPAILAAFLDHDRRHALDQHVIGFVDIAEDAAIDIKQPLTWFDDDRRLLDGGNEIESDCNCPAAGFLAEDDLGQHHLFDRREEVDCR